MSPAQSRGAASRSLIAIPGMPKQNRSSAHRPLRVAARQLITGEYVPARRGSRARCGSNAHDPQAQPSQPTPNRSPALHLPARGPEARTRPTISCPGMSGRIGRGRSPSSTCRFGAADCAGGHLEQYLPFGRLRIRNLDQTQGLPCPIEDHRLHARASILPGQRHARPASTRQAPASRWVQPRVARLARQCPPHVPRKCPYPERTKELHHDGAEAGGSESASPPPPSVDELGQQRP
jgi:hypothetical protein